MAADYSCSTLAGLRTALLTASAAFMRNLECPDTKILATNALEEDSPSDAKRRGEETDNSNRQLWRSTKKKGKEESTTGAASH